MKKVWLTIREATAIVSRNNGRPIHPSYIRLRANQGKIRRKKYDGMTNLYHRDDVEQLVVKKLATKE